MKNKMVKGFFALSVLICCIIVISNASAAVLKKYTSSLSLGTGKYLIGATRSYSTSGAFKLSMKANWLETGSTVVRTQLIKDTGTTNTLIGVQDYAVKNTTTTYKKTFSKKSDAGKYYYAFSTKVDGVSYGGITVPNGKIIMTVETSEL